jgi:hypothetical protein
MLQGALMAGPLANNKHRSAATRGARLRRREFPNTQLLARLLRLPQIKLHLLP